MNRIFFILLFFSYSAAAQVADFILLQKHDKTVETFYAGGHIALTTNSGASVDADIIAIKNDTIFLKQYIVQPVPTSLGVYMLDTVGTYRYQYNYNEIKTVSNFKNGFDFSSSGASLMGSGAILAIASGVVYLADKKSFSPELLIAGGALAVAGYFISKANVRTITIGKKYKLVYVNAMAAKP